MWFYTFFKVSVPKYQNSVRTVRDSVVLLILMSLVVFLPLVNKKRGNGGEGEIIFLQKLNSVMSEPSNGFMR